MLIHGHLVKGNDIDQETRCLHYHTEIDRIAIKFYCCDTYFPCFSCHEESGCNSAQVWPKDQFHQKAVLCGSCGHELTIEEYLSCKSVCSCCHKAFNPGCSLHKHLYFEV
ncbi:MAG: CHY zinc finger protein [Paenisporosarcina sp.]|nr:CHY zinc finger protein [Paenisporosarcina sp.]